MAFGNDLKLCHPDRSEDLEFNVRSMERDLDDFSGPAPVQGRGLIPIQRLRLHSRRGAGVPSDADLRWPAMSKPVLLQLVSSRVQSSDPERAAEPLAA